jgi:uncharacterized protein (TIGR02145 family)
MKDSKLLFTVQFALLILLAAGCSKNEETEKVKDADGNEYATVKINSQVWMAENLRTTKYNDGNSISIIGNDELAWMITTSGAYCWYANNEVNKPTYGALYNGYAVSTGRLCPVGWRVPELDDWLVLIDLLGGVDAAGGELKEKGITHWETPNTNASDKYGFKALPGGRRDFTAAFDLKGRQGWWWTSTDNVTDPDYSSHVIIYYDDGGAYYYSLPKIFGQSVRCIKN